MFWPMAALGQVAPPEAGAFRIATLNADLTRRGPGLLLRDILAGERQVLGIARLVAHSRPDVLLITKFDYDHGNVALHAFAELLAQEGHAMAHRFALRPNSGAYTGLDLSGDRRRNTPDDAQGYGSFAGAAGMALLSRLPFAEDAVQDYSGFLWRDLPGSLIPMRDGLPFPSAEAHAIQRLSSTGHWNVPVVLPGGGRLQLLTFHATPPLFGGRAERNRRRNHDELRFWHLLLDGALPYAPPDPPFVLLGDTNLDPWDGDGMHAAMRAFLAHPLIHDPAPRSAGGAEAATGPLNSNHQGDPAQDTAHWQRDIGPGNLRVDYVLPSSGLEVTGAGVFWPPANDPAHALLADAEGQFTRHRLVWVDIRP